MSANDPMEGIPLEVYILRAGKAAAEAAAAAGKAAAAAAEAEAEAAYSIGKAEGKILEIKSYTHAITNANRTISRANWHYEKHTTAKPAANRGQHAISALTINISKIRHAVAGAKQHAALAGSYATRAAAAAAAAKGKSKEAMAKAADNVEAMATLAIENAELVIKAYTAYKDAEAGIRSTVDSKFHHMAGGSRSKTRTNKKVNKNRKKRTVKNKRRS